MRTGQSGDSAGVHCCDVQVPCLAHHGCACLSHLFYLVREPRKGLTLLGWQVAILLINGAWFGYYMANEPTQRLR
ncbi:MAG UNVERIFIED_CONTAM: hypothetical protein LVT10_16130 [Anaerolineae bacterium]